MVRLWEVRDVQPSPVEPMPRDCVACWGTVCFGLSRKGEVVYTNKGTLRVWDPKSAERSFSTRMPKAHSPGMSGVQPVFILDDTEIVTSGRDGRLLFWDRDTLQPVGEIKEDLELRKLIATSDGKILATTDSSKAVIELWDAKERSPLRTLESKHGAVTEIRFSPSGEMLCATTEDNVVLLWDTKSGRLGTEPLTRGDSSTRGIAFSPDESVLAYCDAEIEVKLWSIEERRELATLSGHHAPIHSIAFSPDGRYVATSAGDFDGVANGTTDAAEIKLWDSTTGSVLSEFSGHVWPVTRVEFTRDGATLASLGMDYRLQLWDVDELLKWGTHQAEQKREK